jgi:1-acyl-sn-glycerol-3-phosphate acyltransferase
LYYFLKYLAWLLVILTISYHRRGIKNIPAKGPLLVVANHMSVSDPVLLGIGLGRRLIFLAKEELFKKPFNAYFVRRFGAIPVYRGSSNREALRKANVILINDGALAMFPEGKRSTRGTMITPQPGSALIAYHNGVPILPIGITGTQLIRGIGWIWNRPKVLINIGEPFYLPAAGKALNREQLNQYSDLIMQKIAELVPQEYRGRYGDTSKDNENENQ